MLLFSFFLSFVAFVAFPDSTEAVLANNVKDVNIETSGNLGIYHHGKCHPTYGNETITSEELSDWCSNIAELENGKKENPFIQYSVKGKQIKAKRYSLRNGCCRYYSLCCIEESGKIVDYYCCCRLYSFSLQASNDNVTWKVLHKVEKDKTIDYCDTRTYELAEPSTPYRYFRFVLDEEWPGCQKCLQINQIEIYGELVASSFAELDAGEDEESISIIGRVKKSEQ